MNIYAPGDDEIKTQTECDPNKIDVIILVMPILRAMNYNNNTILILYSACIYIHIQYAFCNIYEHVYYIMYSPKIGHTIVIIIM